MTPVCEIKKEVYVPSTESRVATSVSMTYIGQGVRREEVRALVHLQDDA